MSKCIECEKEVIHYHGSSFCKGCARVFYQNVLESECINCNDDIEPIYKTGRLTCLKCAEEELLNGF